MSKESTEKTKGNKEFTNRENEKKKR